jgi:hypothetical protein
MLKLFTGEKWPDRIEHSSEHERGGSVLIVAWWQLPQISFE